MNRLGSFCSIGCVLKYKGEATMEPLKPTTQIGILQASPAAAPEEVAEYQRLLAERFTIDPDLPRDATTVNLMEGKRARLKELHKKLFPANTEANGETKASTNR